MKDGKFDMVEVIWVIPRGCIKSLQVLGDMAETH